MKAEDIKLILSNALKKTIVAIRNNDENGASRAAFHALSQLAHLNVQHELSIEFSALADLFAQVEGSLFHPVEKTAQYKAKRKSLLAHIDAK